MSGAPDKPDLDGPYKSLVQRMLQASAEQKLKEQMEEQRLSKSIELAKAMLDSGCTVLPSLHLKEREVIVSHEVYECVKRILNPRTTPVDCVVRDSRSILKDIV